MFTNYFKIAWRNLVRNKIFSIIKISGLSIGLTVCMLIFLYTKDEISYDQFHENKAQLYRIVQTWQFGKDPSQTIGITNSVVGESFAKEIPEVQQYVRINGVAITVKRNNDVFTENSLFVDDNFLSVFTFPLLKGNKGTALKDLHSVVLSKDIAKKYFGAANPMGMTMKIDKQNFIVRGVMAEVPEHFQKLWDLKTQYQRKEETSEEFYGRAGIWAEFGKIICISVGIFTAG